jgi:hypothetical protein
MRDATCRAATSSIDMFPAFLMMHVMASRAVVALHRDRLPLRMWPDLAKTPANLDPTDPLTILHASIRAFPRAVPDRLALG